MTAPRSRSIAVGALALALAAGLAACGSSDDKESSGGGGELAVTISESGKKVKVDAPKSAKGGLTTLKVTNKGKQPHAAQLLLVKGDHTIKDVEKQFSSDETDAAEWLRTEGGIGRVAPGQTASATLKLPAGRYFVVDTSNENGPPAFSELKLSEGDDGSLPDAETTVTAASPGKDKYRWDVSGSLKSGQSQVKFVSKGKEALHFIQAARIVGKASKQDVIEALSKEGKPPKFVDQESFYDTAILDGGKEQITPLELSKPGRWVLFCVLGDRGEKKPHFKEGLIKFVDVK